MRQAVTAAALNGRRGRGQIELSEIGKEKEERKKVKSIGAKNWSEHFFFFLRSFFSGKQTRCPLYFKLLLGISKGSEDKLKQGEEQGKKEISSPRQHDN